MEQDIIIPNDEIIGILRKEQLKSTANKRKVGAILYSFETNSIIASGYNHNNFVNTICENSKGETFDTVIHAESDCILSLLKNPSLLKYIEDTTEPIAMFVTYSPCIECSKLIVQAGFIDYLFVSEEHEYNFRNPIIKESLSAIDFLVKNGVKVYLYNKENKSYERYINPKYNKTVNVCIYHSADLDGFMSGYLMKSYLMNEKDYIFGYNYESDANWIKFVDDLLKENINVNLIFGDISPSTEWLQNHLHYINNDNLELLILDHHANILQEIKTIADENLICLNSIDLRNTQCYDDSVINKSGCEIILKYLSLNNEKPISVKLVTLSEIIGTNDTWRFNNKDYKYTLTTKNKGYFQNLITYLKFKIKTFEDFCLFIDNQLNAVNFDEFAKIGKEIITNKIKQFSFKLSQSLVCISNSKQIFILTEDEYPEFYALECIKNFVSKLIDNNLIYKFDYSNFVYITYSKNLKTKKSKFSVRSYISDYNSKFVNAFDIASYFGGGGHADASGFTLDISEEYDFVLNFESKIKQIIDDSVQVLKL